MAVDIQARGMAGANAITIKGLTSGVKSAVVSGTTIVFTMNDNSKQIMTFPTPADGVSVVSMTIDDRKHLISTMSDNTTIDAGEIPTLSADVEQMIEDKVSEKLSMSYATEADIENLW